MFRRRKALIIEGDESVAKLFTIVLSTSDWDVDTFTDGLRGVDAVSENKDYDIIFLSYLLPGIDGLKLVKAIRAIDHHLSTPIVLVTGSGGVDEDALAAGVDEVLHKPIEINTLLATAQKYSSDNYKCESAL